MVNPFIGVFYHWLGGLASASFYIPYKGVRKWSWETYWLVGGVFSWIIAPWLMAWLLVPDLLTVLGGSPHKAVLWAYIFGAMWGVGGLTFGLTMRYLGIALGMAVALGYCAAFGTLIPPIFDGQIVQLIGSTSGRITLLGVLVCLLGIAISGAAGRSKEGEMSEAEKKAIIKEFNFKKGMLIATFSGIMSSCLAFGLTAGQPIADLAKAHLVSHGKSDLWQNLPVLIVALFGGFTTNFIWCAMLNVRNKSGGEYLNLGNRVVEEISATEGVAPWDASSIASSASTVATMERREVRQVSKPADAPLVRNYIFSAIAGVTWYLQYFFYGMGETRMGQYSFSSWTLHMASIIIFSTLWGVALHEWRGASKRTMGLVVLGLFVLVGSTVVIGYGTYLHTLTTGH